MIPISKCQCEKIKHIISLAQCLAHRKYSIHGSYYRGPFKMDLC